MLQAASGVSSSYDALVDLFERLGGFLKRLRIYTDLPLTPSMTEISVKIMVELLSVLALATKQIKQGRFSKQIVVFDIDISTCHREIRQEATRRKRDRGSPPTPGPSYPGGGPDDGGSNPGSGPWPYEYCEVSHGR